MSKIAFCPKGGQSGILVTEKELGDLALRLGRKMMDEVIPLPDIPFDQQKTRLQEDAGAIGGPARHDEHGQQYWEVEGTGSHGWCCSYCGTVLQWG